MPYQLKYRVDVEWIGVGLGGAGNPPAAQKLTFVQSTALSGANAFATQSPLGGPVVAGAGTGGAINGADITSLTNAMAADIAAQMNSAVPLAQMQAWISGGG